MYSCVPTSIGLARVLKSLPLYLYGASEFQLGIDMLSSFKNSRFEAQRIRAVQYIPVVVVFLL